ncbi:WW/Rsp5/WWP [Penicillium cf. griseofulvum]|uniref:WW/Rsp5/WWP n=1 Tax=Penicillium cf. griseofulvum TaxID=2972120 RepID=A0A9W9M054_9EURO|nr:WW/Rsp5/WWP [Penicillium cf. griseofulvum]KAJ5430512.1 WW/Rsp5/WWP [Penicillium cf. griseofulvum]
MSAGSSRALHPEELFLNGARQESPTIGPLRINKRDSSSPASAAGSSPPPNAPLPYPDDRQRPQMRTSSSNDRYHDNIKYGSPPAGPGSGSVSPNEYPTALRPRDGREPRVATLAERRGAAPKPLPESPSYDAPDRDAIAARQYPRPPASQPAGPPEPPANTSQYDYRQQYYPPPQRQSSTSAARPPSSLQAPQGPLNRISSTSTTRAQRGSPPPPETPVVGPGQSPASDIEARYAAAGIAGTGTLQGIQSHNVAAQRRAEQYSGQQPVFQQQRPWTPTEQPGSQPHGPPTVYQGDEVVTNNQPAAVHPGQYSSPPPQAHPVQYSSPPPQAHPGQYNSPPPQAHPGQYNTPPPQAHPGQYSSPPPQAHPAQYSGSPSQMHPAAGLQQQEQPGRVAPNALEHDMDRMRLSSSPPPAYSSVSGPSASNGYPNEKHSGAAAAAAAPTAAAAGAAMMHPALASQPNPAVKAHSPAQTASPQDHPAFRNDQRQQQQAGQSPQTSVANDLSGFHHQTIQVTSPGPSSAGPASPPPLPEGWIAHMDPSSGQYYYIHLPTQSTQWEFPKGPTPLNLNDTPLSPVASVYSAHPLGSPGLSAFGKPLASPGVPLTPGFESLQSPIVTGFSGPPPSTGMDLYKNVPTNGVYFGPYLRYTNMDLERGVWIGSILLVTDAAQPPTIHMHQSLDLSPNPRQLKAVNIAAHQRWTFYKYEIDLQMDEAGPAKWTYAITSHLGCTRYEFLVAGRHETNWRFIAISGNDFSLNVNASERARVGGVGYMWKDIMQKHNEIGGFHAQLCLGGQIYADRMWKEIPSLKQWLTISGKEARKNAPWTAANEQDVSYAYFHYYTSHFDQPHIRESFAQIPYVCQIDDHDIFDGFGSYPEHMQFSNMFKNIGRIGIEMYLLFQHHTTLDILRNVSNDMDLFTITGTGWHFVKYLGPGVVVVGPDCRSERNPHQVMAGSTYQGLFPKIAMLPPSVQHCLWMVAVPLIYPRLETAEHIVQTVATGKRAVTGAYNVLGKVTSSVAGVVGAKDFVGSGFDSVKRAVGKSGLMGGILSPFGEFSSMDELRDQWTHESKDLERTYLIRTLQGIAHQKSIRMTFLSGAVNVCGAGLVHDPSNPSDHKTMYQLIASSVVNTPPPSYIIKLLHSHSKPLYVPANGHRSSGQVSDTKEDMMEIFQTDVNGQAREYRKLMARRNYVAIVAYDPEAVNASYGMSAGVSKLSLAADFMVQGDGALGNVVKFGPVIVPCLDQGR